MTTQVKTLTTSWQLVNTGACLITAASSVDKAPSEVLATEPEQDEIFIHIGTVLPLNSSFAYHEFTDTFSYPGTESIYMRTYRGTRVVKMSPIV
jgi:hypothetical protein